MKGPFSLLTVKRGWTAVYTTDTGFTETTSGMYHIHPWSCGPLLTVSAPCLPHISSLREQKRTTGSNTKAMLLSQTLSQEWFITFTQTLVVFGQPIHTLKPPQIPLSNSRKFFLSESGTNKALTFLLIRYLTGFPYHLNIINPRKTKAINSSAANIPPKMAISPAVYLLSDMVTATRKTNQCYKA